MHIIYVHIICIYIYSFWMHIHIFIYIYSVWFFFHEHSRITGLQGKGEGISLTLHCHFPPLHRHWNISRAIIAERSPLHIASRGTRTGNLWSLATKLRPLTIQIHDINFSFDFDATIDARRAFLDISKVFDKVWNERMLFKLETYSI